MADQPTSLLAWHYQSPKDCLAALDSSADGLSELEVKKRLLASGANALPAAPPRSKLLILASQLVSPLMIILLLAGVVSFLLGELLDVYIITAAVFINSFLGFLEEFKADRSWRALAKYLPAQAKVRRQGVIQTINASQIVPGDVLLLKAGDQITADGRLLEAFALETTEAALTGESTSVSKSVRSAPITAQIADQTSMIFAGTTVAAGRGEAVVVATGAQTQIGQVSRLVASVGDWHTPLEVQLKKLARQLGAAVVFLAVVVFTFGLVSGFSAQEMFRLSVALAVSAVPEGLVVALTVILAIGMQRILRQRGLVRKLVAAETLGNVSILCVDKTGTLTTGEMAVDEIWIDGELLPLHLENNSDLDRLRLIIGLVNGAVQERDPESGETRLSGTLTEMAMARYLLPYREALGLGQSEILSEIPFDSRHKYAARLAMFRDQKILAVIGAPDVLLSRLDLSDAQRKKVQATYEAMASQGQRVLMVTESRTFEGEEIDDQAINDLTLLGFVGLRDPVRPDVAQFVATASEAGVKCVMITGDHPQTGRVIAAQVGLTVTADSVLTGVELDQLTDEELTARITKVTVFARVRPEQKLRIVRAWQARGAVVAMTGDGVNDAPAIKAADIGIALGSATAVAKETADLVLLDDSFKTIVLAIREGRVIFDNLRKTVVYLLADSFSEVILVFGALAFSQPLPILPAQILWINLITDGLPSAALAFEPAEDGVMKDRPRPKLEPVLNRQMKFLIFVIGVLTDLGLFGIYFYLLGQDLPLNEIRTFIFVALGLDSLLYVFAVRKIRLGFWQSNPLENRWLVASVVIGLGLQFLPLISPVLRELFDFTVLTGLEIAVILALSFGKLMLIELVKLRSRRLRLN